MPGRKYGHCYFGTIYSVPPAELPPGAFADSKNVYPNQEGLPEGRGGSVRLNNTAFGSRTTSFFEARSATTRYQLASYGTKIGYYNSATREFVDAITGLTTNKMLQWVNFGGKAICVNEGANAPQYFTDPTTKGALGGSPPSGKTITTFANRVWFGGTTANPAQLTGSALNAPEDYATGGAAGYFQGTVGDEKEAITGLASFHDWLLIGQRNNIYKLSGSPATDASSLSIEPVFSKGYDNIGFTSPWAISLVGNDLLFLDGVDIKRLSGVQDYGDVESASIADNYRDFLKDIVDTDYLYYTQFFHYKAKEQLWVSIPTSATARFVFVLDYKFKQRTGDYAFYPMGEVDAICFGGVENSNLTDIYFGDGDGYVNQLDTGNNDNGSAIDRYCVSVVSGNSNQREQSVDDGHEYRKQFDRSETFIRPTVSTLSMTPSYAVDLLDWRQAREPSNYTALGTEFVSGWQGTGVKNKRIRFFGVSGHTLFLKWAHSTVGQNFQLYPSQVHFTWKTHNRFI